MAGGQDQIRGQIPDDLEHERVWDLRKKKIGDDKRFRFTRYLRRGAPQWQKPRREGGGGGLLVETGVGTGESRYCRMGALEEVFTR